MRLFYAVNFSAASLALLQRLTADLAAAALTARPTRPENHHLTLVFLGEQPDEKPFCELLRQLDAPGFTMRQSALGCFRRDGGDLWWLGLQPQPRLQALYRQLSAALTATGFAVDRRPYRPHLTLLREATFPASFDPAAFLAGYPPFREPVRAVSLMLSERRDGILTYTELERCALRVSGEPQPRRRS